MRIIFGFLMLAVVFGAGAEDKSAKHYFDIQEEPIKSEEEKKREEAEKARRQKERDDFYANLLKKHGGAGTESAQVENAVTGRLKGQ